MIIGEEDMCTNLICMPPSRLSTICTLYVHTYLRYYIFFTPVSLLVVAVPFNYYITIGCSPHDLGVMYCTYICGIH